MARVTENWSEYRIKFGESATRVYIVDEVADAEQAARAAGVPAEGSTHQRDNSLYAESPDVQQISQTPAYRVTVNYAPQDPAAAAEQPNPVSRKARVSWGRFDITEITEVDPEGNPIVNSAGDVPDPPPTEEVAVRVLTIKKWESSFDLSLAGQYEDTTNADEFSLGNGHTVAKGQALCRTIMPAEEYDIGTPKPLLIVYTFWLRNGDEPWRRRFIDQGFRATYADEDGKIVPGELFSRSGVQASRECRLDGQGRPFDSSLWKIERDDKEPAPNGEPQGAKVERKEKAVILAYRRYRETSFTGLGIF